MALHPYPMGAERLFDVANTRRWMRGALAYRPGMNADELAREAGKAFQVETFLAAYDDGEHWVWDVAREVLGA